MITDYSRRRFLRHAAASVLVAPLSGQPGSRVASLEALLDGSAFVEIPAGEFRMGFAGGLPDEHPEHRVRITRQFEMGKFEVTQAQWTTVMTDPHTKPDAARPTPLGHEASTKPSEFPDPARPVEKVSWDDIQVFLRRLNSRDAKHTYRLPTEAEWEYAAKAGASEPDTETLRAMAWNKGNSGEQTHPVGQKKPNAWGLYDMHGNVSEWVQDWWAPDTYEEELAVDPKGPPTGSYRVFRGGCWFDPDADCRTTVRHKDFPISRFHNVGFRLVRAPR